MDKKEEAVYFVFYKNNGYSWKYNKFPHKWRWSGSGMTKYDLYPREEQFNGYKYNSDKMLYFLEKTFKKLKETNKIKGYKIYKEYPSYLYRH